MFLVVCLMCTDEVTLVTQKLLYSMHETHEEDKAWAQQ